MSSPRPRPPPCPCRRAARFPVHRIYCVGRNYAEHAKEMGFTGREPPFFFMKPADAVLAVADGETGRMAYPSAHQRPAPRDRAGRRHRHAAAATSRRPRRCQHVWGYAVGLDMTRRDLQGDAKKPGRPWSIGKGFDQSAPIGPMARRRGRPASCRRRHHAGGQRRAAPAGRRRRPDLERRARPSSSSVAAWTLQPGDLIFTGTPAGVARGGARRRR